MPSRRGTGGHPRTRDGDGRIVRTVGQFENEAPLVDELFVGWPRMSHDFAHASVPQRSSLRITSFKPDHTSLTAHTFTSTKPSGSATARIVSSVMSVATPDAFFGHDTQITASAWM